MQHDNNPAKPDKTVCTHSSPPFAAHVSNQMRRCDSGAAHTDFTMLLIRGWARVTLLKTALVRIYARFDSALVCLFRRNCCCSAHCHEFRAQNEPCAQTAPVYDHRPCDCKRTESLQRPGLALAQLNSCKAPRTPTRGKLRGSLALHARYYYGSLPMAFTVALTRFSSMLTRLTSLSWPCQVPESGRRAGRKGSKRVWRQPRGLALQRRGSVVVNADVWTLA